MLISWTAPAFQVRDWQQSAWYKFFPGFQFLSNLLFFFTLQQATITHFPAQLTDSLHHYFFSYHTHTHTTISADKMFSPTTTTQPVAVKGGILRKRRSEGGPQAVPKKRVRFVDTSSERSPSLATAPAPVPTRPRRRIDWGPALPPVETAAVRAARIAERNQFWDEGIKVCLLELPCTILNN